MLYFMIIYGRILSTPIRFMTYDESPYIVPEAIVPLESNGRRGDRILIEGRQTGLARVSVRLANPAYQVWNLNR